MSESDETKGGGRVVPIGAGRKRPEADEPVELVEVWLLEGTELVYLDEAGAPRIIAVPRPIHLFLPPDQLELTDDDGGEGWAS